MLHQKGCNAPWGKSTRTLRSCMHVRYVYFMLVYACVSGVVSHLYELAASVECSFESSQSPIVVLLPAQQLLGQCEQAHYLTG
jgi:hypothetical protein